MGATKLARRAVSVAALSTALAGIAAGAAEASSEPPKADNVLLGTWLNTNPTTNSVKQVDITPSHDGSVSVDAFGACTPTLCEWGGVPAIV